MLQSEKIKYWNEKVKKISKTKKTIWPYVVLIIFLLWGCVSLGNALRRGNEQYSKGNAEVTKQLEELHRELKSLRDEFNVKQTEQDKKIETAKVAKQSLKSMAVQRPVLSGGCEQYRPLISQYAWNVETVLAICSAESGGNANAVNAGDRHETCLGSYGLLQIDCGWYYKANLFDPVTNIRLGYGKYLASGYLPWSVCRTKVNCVI